MTPRLGQLLARLADAPVLIWGARMTGLGLVRLCETHQIDVRGFIDSDPSFAGKRVAGLDCQLPTALPALRQQHPGMKVVVAASTKEGEINRILLDLGFAPAEFINYSGYCDLFYTIDVMGTCNLKCLSCAHGAEGDQYKRGSMTLETYRRVVDKIVAENEVVNHISLYSWGEPFLNPALPDMVAYLHRHGIAAALSSNLSIKNDALFRKVLQQDPEYLKVSLSGYYPAAYDTTHQGGDIHLVRSNLLRLRYYIDHYRLNTVVDVNYHLYANNNRGNLRKMQDLCDELRFSLSQTYALVMPLERVIDKLEGRPSPSTLALEKNLLVSVEEGIRAAAIANQEEQPCPFLENQTVINCDLSVPICCTTFNRGPNLVATNFLEVSPEQIAAGKQKAAICRTCVAHGLPAYNLGLNRRRWEEIAAQKPSTDLP